FDVLLPCLQCHTECTVILCVDANSDDPTRHRSFEIFLCSKESRVRATVAKRHSKTLRRSESCIHTKFPWRSQQGQCKKVSRHSEIAACVVDAIDKFTMILDGSEIVGILHNCTKKLTVNFSSLIIPKNDFNSQWGSSGNDHIFGLRENFVVDKKLSRLYFIRFVHVMKEHAHGFSSGSGFIEQRRIGDR